MRYSADVVSAFTWVITVIDEIKKIMIKLIRIRLLTYVMTQGKALATSVLYLKITSRN